MNIHEAIKIVGMLKDGDLGKDTNVSRVKSILQFLANSNYTTMAATVREDQEISAHHRMLRETYSNLFIHRQHI